MAQLKVSLVFLLLSVVVLFHWPKASVAFWGGGADGNVVAPRTRRTLDTQLMAGGEVQVQVPVQAAPHDPSPPLLSGNLDRYGALSPQCAPPSPPPSPPPPEDPGRCIYIVTTQTGDQWTASTDSTISIRLENGEEKNVYMVLTEGNIQTGEQDTFVNEEKCVRGICKMTLYTDGSGWLPSWYVVWVRLEVRKVDNQFVGDQSWQIDEWLPAHEWSGASSLVRDKC